MENMAETTSKLEVWTEDDYYKDQRDICLQGYDEEKLWETVDDWIEDLDLYDAKDVPAVVEAAKEVKVLMKDCFKLDVNDMYDYVIDRSCNYGMDYYEKEPEGMELIPEFVKKFNALQYWYTGGEQIAILDISEQVKEYYFDAFDIPEDKREETWQEWLRLDKEETERLKALYAEKE
jgi:hypothetical protein